jgi:3-oxoacyl-(acyl-carrier-protein) synthase
MIKIGVTGMGAISALGCNVDEQKEALNKGFCGIGPVSYADGLHSAAPRLVGEVGLSKASLLDKLGLSDTSLTRTSLLALHAFQEAVSMAQMTPEQLMSPDTALLVGTTVGGMCLTDTLYRDGSGNQENSKDNTRTYEYDFVAGSIQRQYGLTGPLTTINTACSSSANAIALGARLVRSGRVKRAIVGGADALAKFTVFGFNALRLLSDELCCPFDAARKGLNLGEGAAFLVLEEIRQENTGRAMAFLSGSGNTCDAYHPTSLREEAKGPIGAMVKAIMVAGLLPSDIGFVNAHGTATENNDVVEHTALRSVFGDEVKFGSTKANTGHTLGAAGALEAVFSILSLRQQEFFPQLHFKHPMDAAATRPVTIRTQASFDHIMSNSFGFGGNCTSLVFSKIPA